MKIVYKMVQRVAQGTSIGLLTSVMLLSSTWCKAQLNPMQSIYYQNRYLINPAQAGLEDGLNLNLSHQQQWNPLPGAPKSEWLTADFKSSDKVGVGLNISDNTAGLFGETRIVGTYAYHLPLDDRGQKLNFGISFGFNSTRLNTSAINGDLTDPVIGQYNNAKASLDGDFGISYTGSHLFIAGVFPDLKATFNGSNDQRIDVDRTIFVGMISYKLGIDEEVGPFSLEPLAAYRKIKGFKDIYDAGLYFKMNAYKLDLQAIYHSNDAVGLGFVVDQPGYALNFTYNLQTGPLTSYTNGTFELGIKLKLLR